MKKINSQIFLFLHYAIGINIILVKEKFINTFRNILTSTKKTPTFTWVSNGYPISNKLSELLSFSNDSKIAVRDSSCFLLLFIQSLILIDVKSHTINLP